MRHRDLHLNRSLNRYLKGIQWIWHDKQGGKRTVQHCLNGDHVQRAHGCGGHHGLTTPQHAQEIRVLLLIQLEYYLGTPEKASRQHNPD